MASRWLHMELHSLLSRRPAVEGWARPLIGRLEAPVEAAAFWTAVALPLVYLALLTAGVDSTADAQLFLGLVGLHLVSLIGGRDHRS